MAKGKKKNKQKQQQPQQQQQKQKSNKIPQPNFLTAPPTIPLKDQQAKRDISTFQWGSTDFPSLPSSATTTPISNSGGVEGGSSINAAENEWESGRGTKKSRTFDTSSFSSFTAQLSNIVVPPPPSSTAVKKSPPLNVQLNTLSPPVVASASNTAQTQQQQKPQQQQQPQQQSIQNIIFNQSTNTSQQQNKSTTTQAQQQQKGSVPFSSYPSTLPNLIEIDLSSWGIGTNENVVGKALSMAKQHMAKFLKNFVDESKSIRGGGPSNEQRAGPTGEEKKLTLYKMIDHQKRVGDRQSISHQASLSLATWDISAMCSFLLTPNCIVTQYYPVLKGYAIEIQRMRNAWAHQNPLSIDDTFRLLDTIEKFFNEIDDDKAAMEVQIIKHTNYFYSFNNKFGLFSLKETSTIQDIFNFVNNMNGTPANGQPQSSHHQQQQTSNSPPSSDPVLIDEDLNMDCLDDTEIDNNKLSSQINNSNNNQIESLKLKNKKRKNEGDQQKQLQQQHQQQFFNTNNNNNNNNNSIFSMNLLSQSNNSSNNNINNNSNNNPFLNPFSQLQQPVTPQANQQQSATQPGVFNFGNSNIRFNQSNQQNQQNQQNPNNNNNTNNNNNNNPNFNDQQLLLNYIQKNPYLLQQPQQQTPFFQNNSMNPQQQQQQQPHFSNSQQNNFNQNQFQQQQQHQHQTQQPFNTNNFNQTQFQQQQQPQQQQKFSRKQQHQRQNNSIKDEIPQNLLMD